MSPRIIECDQNSPEWIAARLGVPTASMFSAIMAKGEGKTRKSYLYRLAGEIVTGEPAEIYSNAHMERGHVLEPDARDLYAFTYDIEPERVGFIVNGDVGCSPDSLLGDDGVLEIKSKLPAILIDAMLRDDYPPEHKAQVQGILWVAERQWVDLAMYWPKLPLVVRRIERDEAYINQLAETVGLFVEELRQTVQWVRRYGQPDDAINDDIANRRLSA